MSITFEQIGEFISKNLIWFLIPIILFILGMFILVLVRFIKYKKKHKKEKGNVKKKRV